MSQDPASAPPSPPRKGPLSFLSGSLTSLLLGWVSLGVSGRVLAYYAEHPPIYKAPIAQSIGTAVKTMVVGTTFLATFSFGFVGLGLFLVFLRSLWPGAADEAASPGTAAAAAATDAGTPAVPPSPSDPGPAGG
ncbi:MAG: DUF3082 domain-containing protein [Synechococcaceae cyanobacterium ELA445]|jgi:hypothetical protein